MCAFYVWLLSCIMFSRFMHIVACIIPFNGWMLFIVWIYNFNTSIYQFIDIWVVVTLGPLWILLLWTFASKFLCEDMFLVLFSVYLGGELWSYMIILHLTFWGTINYFLQQLNNFTFPTVKNMSFSLSTPLPTAVIFCFHLLYPY